MAAALAILTEALDEPGTDIAHSVHRLTLDAAAAVTSYLGLSVVVSHSDSPFSVTALADGALAGDIRTSLHVSLPGPSDRQNSPAVAIILYAGSPGAFVDLAADLAWLTARSPSDFILDQHLTLAAGSLPEGQLRAASAINQALGVLIGRGYTPQRAHGELDTQAAHAGTDRRTAAHHILAKINTGDGDQHFGIYWGLSD
jgi:hypothetical protein